MNQQNWYEAYDVSQKKFGHFKEWWNRIHLKRMGFFDTVDKDHVILDIGCGDGNVLRTLLAKRYINLYGFDVRIPEDHDPRLVLKNGSMLDLPYRDDFADCLICFNVMHHLQSERDYDKFLRNCARVLKPSGSFYVVEPEDNFFRWMQGLLLRIPIISDISPIREQKIAVSEEQRELDLFMTSDIPSLFRQRFDVISLRSYLKSFILVCSQRR